MPTQRCREGRKDHCWHEMMEVQVSQFIERVASEQCCFCPGKRLVKVILKEPDGHGPYHPHKMWVKTDEEVTLEVANASR